MDKDLPFQIVTLPDSDTVSQIECALCGVAIFDAQKDGEITKDTLTKVAVMHLALSHSDKYKVTPSES